MTSDLTTIREALKRALYYDDRQVVTDNIDYALAALNAVEAQQQQLRDALTELLVYTAEVETRLMPWVASRPNIASFPTGGKDIGDRVRAALNVLNQDTP